MDDQKRLYDFRLVVIDTRDKTFNLDDVDVLRQSVENGWEILNGAAAGAKMLYVMRKSVTSGK